MVQLVIGPVHTQSPPPDSTAELPLIVQLDIGPLH
jgi:hypothetical protein